MSTPSVPVRIVDCHHHFLTPNEPFHASINALGAPAYSLTSVAALVGLLCVKPYGRHLLPGKLTAFSWAVVD